MSVDRALEMERWRVCEQRERLQNSGGEERSRGEGENGRESGYL
jgi:hypothetical protein